MSGYMTGCLGITGMEDACLVPFWDAIPFLQERATSFRQGTPWKINMQPENHLFETENPLNHPPSFSSFHSMKVFRVPAPPVGGSTCGTGTLYDSKDLYSNPASPRQPDNHGSWRLLLDFRGSCSSRWSISSRFLVGDFLI